MTILRWRNAQLRSGAADRGALQTFRCTDEELRTEFSVAGAQAVHSRMYEWTVQEIIRERVRAMKKSRWIVRLGEDDQGLGAVMVAQEIDVAHQYDLLVGAIAVRLRGRHRGELGAEMMADMQAEIIARCIQAESYDDVKLTGMVHQDNRASKRMCSAAKLRCQGPSSEHDEYEDWSGLLAIPQPDLFDR